MKITVDLENVENSDINNAIVRKINSLTKEDIKELLKDENVKSAFCNAIKDITLKIFNEEWAKTKGTFYIPAISRDQFIESIKEERENVIENDVKEIFDNAIKEQIGEDKFKDLIVELLPEALISAMIRELYGRIDKYEEANRYKVISKINDAINNNR